MDHRLPHIAQDDDIFLTHWNVRDINCMCEMRVSQQQEGKSHLI